MKQDTISIFVLDDDPVDTALLARALRKIDAFSVEIESAETLEDAYALASGRTFDLYFVDYWLGPDTATPFLLDLAAANPYGPMILVSSLDRTDLAEAGVPADRFEFITKRDLSPDRLEQVIRGALAAARRNGDLAAEVAALGAVDLEGPDKVLGWLHGLLGDINRIHGSASLALNSLGEGAAGSPAEALLGATVKTSDRLRLGLIERIGRVEAARRVSHAVEANVDITGFLEEVVADYRPEAEKRGQQLAYHKPDLPLTFATDPGALRDVLRLLLRNTIRNTAEGARIDISLSVREGEVCIAVSDTSADGHWASTIARDAAADCDRLMLCERAGSLILLDQLMRACNGSVDLVAKGGDPAVLCCSFPLRGAA